MGWEVEWGLGTSLANLFITALMWNLSSVSSDTGPYISGYILVNEIKGTGKLFNSFLIMPQEI